MSLTGTGEIAIRAGKWSVCFVDRKPQVQFPPITTMVALVYSSTVGQAPPGLNMELSCQVSQVLFKVTLRCLRFTLEEHFPPQTYKICSNIYVQYLYIKHSFFVYLKINFQG